MHILIHDFYYLYSTDIDIKPTYNNIIYYKIYNEISKYY